MFALKLAWTVVVGGGGRWGEGGGKENTEHSFAKITPVLEANALWTILDYLNFFFSTELFVQNFQRSIVYSRTRTVQFTAWLF